MDNTLRQAAFKPMLLLLFALIVALIVFLLPSQPARAYTDPSNMTDASFFSKLNLDYPGLATVKANVAAGNYTAAKTNLLSYYQNRTTPVYFTVGTTPSGGPMESSPDDLVNYIFTILGETKNFSGSGGIQWDETWSGGSWSNGSFNNRVNEFLMYNILAPAYNGLAPGDPKRIAYSDTWMKFALEFIVDKGNTNIASEVFLDMAKRLSAWNMAYSVFRNSPSIDSNGNAAYLKHIWQMADYAYTNIESTEGNNWYASIARSMYVTGVYFPEFKDAESWRMRGEGAMSKYIGKHIKGDGMNSEPTENYHLYALQLANTIQKFGQLNGYSNVLKDSRELLERSAEFTMDALLPNLEEGPMIGDSSYKNFSPHSVLNDYSTIYGRSDFEYVATDRAGGTMPDHTSVVYPNSSAIMRTGWNDNDKYMYIENGDTNYGGSHNHPDDLSLVMYAFGKRLIADPGVYTYDMPNTVGQWLRDTTEAHNTVEVNNAPQSLGGKRQLNKWISNDGFDIYDGQHDSYAPIHHNRKVFFVKPNYWIVSDVMTGGSSANTYEQLWHFLPNTLSLNGTSKAVTTQFAGEPNVKIVPADPSSITAAVRNGYYSDTYNSYSAAQYLAYTKSASDSTSYDTVIFPEDTGQNHNVTVSRLAMSGVNPHTATALTIHLDAGNNGNVAAYYLSHETTHPTRSFGTYGYNGELAYIEKTSGGALSQIAITEGSLLTDGATNLLSATGKVQNLSVKYSGTTLQLSSSDKLAYTVTIFAPGVTSVTFNGAGIGFTTAGNFITVAAAGASTASTVLTDSFDTDPPTNDLTDEFYNFESGSATGWQPVNGTWSVVTQGAGKVYRQTDNTGVNAKTVTTSTWTDVLVEADVTTVSTTTATNGVQLMARYQDALNTYTFRYYVQSGTASLRIEKIVAGTTTVLATTPFTMNNGTTYKLKGTISGNTLKLYVDGTLILSATDSAINGGYVGLSTHRRDAYFDNIKVAEIIGDEPLTNELHNFESGSATGWQPINGTWSVVAQGAGQVYRQTDDASVNAKTVTTSKWTDVLVEADVTTVSSTTATNGVHLMARYQDALNTYTFRYYVLSGTASLRIEKVFAGTTTVLATTPFTMATGTTYKLKGTISGNTLKLYVDGTLYLTATDRDITEGFVGLSAHRRDVYFDNVKVSEVIGDDWEINRGPWSIDNSELYTDSLSLGHSEVRTRQQNDLYAYSGQAKVKVVAWGATPASAGLVARSLGINDGYRFLLYNSGSGTKLRIEKVLSGLQAISASTVLAEKTYTISTGTYYTLKATVEGGVLKLYVNGTLELSAYDTTLPRGGFGFRATNAQASFDSVLLERLQ
ncbi:heparinase II/III family protein [Paenibacillus sp. HJGM_3]|uniref:heparinase II/III family protein n=1 Tax=Paenibacillus sp. HJGM_3 TaxID=3379816 RepID=UPI00385A6376